MNKQYVTKLFTQKSTIELNNELLQLRLVAPAD